MIAEQIVGAAMWPISLQTAEELDVLDRRSRLIDGPVVDSTANRDLVDLNYEQVSEVVVIRVMSPVRELVFWD